MFKRLVAWFKNRKTPKTVTVFGWETGPDRKPVWVALREVPYVKPTYEPERSEWPAPEPARLKQLGPSEELARAQGAAKARTWLVMNLPDECTFM